MPIETQVVLRSLYGVSLLVLFLRILPFGRAYFTSERYGGSIDSTRGYDFLFSPMGYRLGMALWILSAVMIVFGIQTLFFSAVNLLLCYFHFIHLRWKSLTRGMGAPGFITYWIAALVFLLEYADRFGDPGGKLRSLVLFAFQWDFALIMIDSGIHKITHGYRQDRGMNYGMANPAWGYWANFFQKGSPNRLFYRLLNHSAYSFEILGGLLMLFPATHTVGALIIFLSFLLVKMVIRLGVLCDQLMLITVLYTHSGGWLHQMTQSLVSPETSSVASLPWLNTVVTFCLTVYIVLIPLARIGLYYNFYLKKSLPSLVQRILESFTNTFGIILWRVFTFDLINFFVRIYFVRRGGFWHSGPGVSEKGPLARSTSGY